MPGGNPNHDPKTGKFASKSGLNVSNSTTGQRARAKVVEHVKAAGSFGKDVAIGVATGIGIAALAGVTHVVKRRMAGAAADALNKHSPAVRAYAAAAASAAGQALKSTSLGGKLTDRVSSLHAHVMAQHEGAKRVSAAPRAPRVGPPVKRTVVIHQPFLKPRSS